MTFRLIVLTVSMVCLGGAQGPLRLEIKRIEKKSADCHVSFEYPEIISAPSPQVRDRINAGILRLLLRETSGPASESGVRSLDAYANVFLERCAEFQKRPEARGLYERKRVSSLRNTPPVLSFRVDADEDGGGVHPFGTTVFVNFESATGKTIGLADFLKEGALAKLESIAEANFRKEQKLSSSDRLSESGYSFPGDRFRLNDNFGIGERELVFLFNTYEIGPGAMGATTITIFNQQIRELLKPALHLW
jgi:hypothetical protein